MKKAFDYVGSFLCTIFILAAATVTAQAPGDTVKTTKPNDPMVVNPGMPDDQAVINPGHANDEMAVMTDTGFIHKNIMDNMMEIELSKLGRDKGTSPLVKKAATQMITDHTAILNDLKRLSAKKGSSPAEHNMHTMPAMPPMDIPEGSDFNATWASAMLTMHEAKIAELEKFISVTRDPAIKAAASKALPKIKMHRTMLSQIPGVKAGLGPDKAIQ